MRKHDERMYLTPDEVGCIKLIARAFNAIARSLGEPRAVVTETPVNVVELKERR